MRSVVMDRARALIICTHLGDYVPTRVREAAEHLLARVGVSEEGQAEGSSIHTEEPMKGCRTLMAAVLLATLPVAASAAVAILAPPDNSCGSWVALRRDNGPKIWQVEEWAMGFLSGMAVVQSGSNYLEGLDENAIYGWLDNYCSAHPLATLADALKELASERGMRR
jgi:hypothetical protein